MTISHQFNLRQQVPLHQVQQMIALAYASRTPLHQILTAMNKNFKAIVFLFSFFIAAATNCYSQSITKTELIGTWQRDTSLVGSGYLDNYKFFKNGRFDFEPSEAEGLRLLIYFRGNYKLIGDTLKLSPDSISELVGGTPEISHTYGGNG